MSNWKYYNHALIPTTSPHVEPDTTELKDKKIWGQGGKALFARWTTNFDCGYETNWWYCIKDDKFDIDSVKSKIRYYIKKGIANFDVRLIDPLKYENEIYEVQVNAFAVYPKAYRPDVTKGSCLADIKSWGENSLVFGAFENENGTLQGYSVVLRKDDCVKFDIQKTNPEYEKLQINAALVYAIVDYFNDRLSKDFYIVDGERNLMHQTAFQDYLERYFGFRKAYCKLNIKYSRSIKLIVKAIYPLRKIIYKMHGGFAKKIGAVLKTEEIIRQQKYLCLT